jgi:ribonucleotide reductase beta subunit family protein with ferritin-like domain
MIFYEIIVSNERKNRQNQLELVMSIIKVCHRTHVCMTNIFVDSFVFYSTFFLVYFLSKRQELAYVTSSYGRCQMCWMSDAPK